MQDYNDFVDEFLNEEEDFYRRLPNCNCCGAKMDGDCYKIKGQLLCSECTWNKYGACALDYMEN